MVISFWRMVLEFLLISWMVFVSWLRDRFGFWWIEDFRCRVMSELVELSIEMFGGMHVFDDEDYYILYYAMDYAMDYIFW